MGSEGSNCRKCNRPEICLQTKDTRYKSCFYCAIGNFSSSPWVILNSDVLNKQIDEQIIFLKKIRHLLKQKITEIRAINFQLMEEYKSQKQTLNLKYPQQFICALAEYISGLNFCFIEYKQHMISLLNETREKYKNAYTQCKLCERKDLSDLNLYDRLLNKLSRYPYINLKNEIPFDEIFLKRAFKDNIEKIDMIKNLTIESILQKSHINEGPKFWYVTNDCLTNYENGSTNASTIFSPYDEYFSCTHTQVQRFGKNRIMIQNAPLSVYIVYIQFEPYVAIRKASKRNRVLESKFISFNDNIVYSVSFKTGNCEKYNLLLNKWTDLKNVELCEPSLSLSIYMNRYLYVFSNTCSFERLDILNEENGWEIFSIKTAFPNQSCIPASLQISDYEIFVFGNYFSFGFCPHSEKLRNLIPGYSVVKQPYVDKGIVHFHDGDCVAKFSTKDFKIRTNNDEFNNFIN